MSRDIFTPAGTTKHISATATTGRVALPVFTTDRSVRVYNRANEVVFIEFGDSTVEAAVATSLPLGSGACETFQVGGAVTHVAAITSVGSGTIDFTEGQGA